MVLTQGRIRHLPWSICGILARLRYLSVMLGNFAQAEAGLLSRRPAFFAGHGAPTAAVLTMRARQVTARRCCPIVLHAVASLVSPPE